MILSLDTETTILGGGTHGVDLTKQDGGGVHNPDNFLVCISYATPTESGCLYQDNFDKIKPLIEKATLIVGFNFKFDNLWLRRYDIDVSDKRIWDCQAAEFILNRQETPYPSLDDCAEKYSLGKKLDVVKHEYWEKGIDTDQVPHDILSEYAILDAQLTYQVYLKQNQIAGNKKRLISLACQDQHTLADMEWNGLRYDRATSLNRAKELEEKIKSLQKTLDTKHNVPNFNWNSNDHLSALLFGGTITDIVKVPSGVYKTGKRAGEIKFSNEERTYTLPRKFKPAKKTETSKPGIWKVGEDILRTLPKNDLSESILELRKLEKLKNTYLEGLPARQDQTNCDKDYIFGQFNQCVARTGRLSSAKPNLQNVHPDAQTLFISRY